MATRTTYYPGGYIPGTAQQNRAELFDGAAGTYTAWNAAGVQTAQRALTAAEAADLAAQDTAATASTNQATLQQQAQAALANNRTYLAIASPTNAQVAAQVKALTQQSQALIRLALSQFDATN